MTTLNLRPHDTLFLRDGRPFNQGDQEQVASAGIFPPYPPTIIGALRAALARAGGWAGGGWSAETKAKLGDGVDWSTGDRPLGPLRFRGPFVLRREEPLFPAPLCLLVRRARGAVEAVDRLAPGMPLNCDFGRVALPQKVGGLQGAKVPEDDWIDAAGLRSVLDGEVPAASSFVEGARVWQTETRVGIWRDADTRTTGEGALYAAAHVRLDERVALAVEVKGADVRGLEGAPVPFGGEGRSVWIEARNTIDLPAAPPLHADADGTLRYTVVLLTPAYFGDTEEDWPRPGEPFPAGDGGPALPGRVVSACVGKPVPVGGWDGEARRPLALRPLVPAGSVWFLEADPRDVPAALDRHGEGIGRSTGWGFGLCAIGRWRRGESDGG